MSTHAVGQKRKASDDFTQPQAKTQNVGTNSPGSSAAGPVFDRLVRSADQQDAAQLRQRVEQLETQLQQQETDLQKLTKTVEELKEKKLDKPTTQQRDTGAQSTARSRTENTTTLTTEEKLKKAQECFQQNLNVDAIKLLLTIEFAETHPDYGSLQWELGKNYFALTDYNNAKICFNKISDTHPLSAEAQYKLKLIKLQECDYKADEDTCKYFSDIPYGHKYYNSAQAILGKIYTAHKNFYKVKEHLIRLPISYELYYLAQIGLGDAYFHLQEYTNARECFTRAINSLFRIQPETQKGETARKSLKHCYEMMSKIHRKEGVVNIDSTGENTPEIRAPERGIHRSVNGTPNQPLQNQLGQRKADVIETLKNAKQLSIQNNSSAAIDLLNALELAETHPKYADVQFDLGFYHHKLKNYDKARIYCSRVSDLHPLSTEAKYLLKIIDFDLGMYENSLIEYFAEIPSSNKNYNQSQYCLGRIYFSRKEYPKAREHWIKVSNSFTGYGTTQYNLAIIHSYLNEYPQAQEYLNKAKKILSQVPPSNTWDFKNIQDCLRACDKIEIELSQKLKPS
jgi:tetratricopeptide (TPR) repeat protein